MSNDSQLQQAVMAELKWEPSVDAAHIGVTAHAGVVTLTGHVGSFMEKRAADSAAHRVNGVNAVAEEIEVRLPFDVKRDDEEIAAAAVHRLAWDVSIPFHAVKVKVEKGWITLTGEVDWHFQKEAAMNGIRALHGVRGVSDEIKIKPQVNVENVSDDIMHALHRSWYFDEHTIKVKANAGHITLSGTAHTPHERYVAGETAWAAPGATSVENHITIA